MSTKKSSWLPDITLLDWKDSQFEWDVDSLEWSIELPEWDVVDFDFDLTI